MDEIDFLRQNKVFLQGALAKKSSGKLDKYCDEILDYSRKKNKNLLESSRYIIEKHQSKWFGKRRFGFTESETLAKCLGKFIEFCNKKHNSNNPQYAYFGDVNNLQSLLDKFNQEEKDYMNRERNAQLVYGQVYDFAKQLEDEKVDAYNVAYNKVINNIGRDLANEYAWEYSRAYYNSRRYYGYSESDSTILAENLANYSYNFKYNNTNNYSNRYQYDIANPIHHHQNVNHAKHQYSPIATSHLAKLPVGDAVGQQVQSQYGNLNPTQEPGYGPLPPTVNREVAHPTVYDSVKQISPFNLTRGNNLQTNAYDSIDTPVPKAHEVPEQVSRNNQYESAGKPFEQNSNKRTPRNKKKFRGKYDGVDDDLGFGKEKR